MKNLTAIIFIRNASLCKMFANFISQFTPLITIEALQDHFRCLEKIEQYSPDILFIDPEDPIMGHHDFLILANRPLFILGLIQDQDKTKIMNYLDDGIFDLLSVQDLSFPYICKKMNKIKFIAKMLEGKGDRHFVGDPDLLKYSSKKRQESMFVKHEKSSVRVRFDEILYIKNMGASLKLYLTNNRILHHKSTVKKFIEQLPDDFFIRVNNATIVNFKRIDIFEKNSIFIQDENFPVTRVYLEPLKSRIITKS